MADIERPIRHAAMEMLQPWFICREEHPVTLRTGAPGVVDVLAIPKESRFSDFPWAIEVKTRKRMTDPGVAAWIKQASDYVGAEPRGDYPRITHAFLWMVGLDPPANDQERTELRSKMDVGHQFRVGMAQTLKGDDFVFLMGPDVMFRSNGILLNDGRRDVWPGRALERLTSRRQSAGLRGRQA